MAKDLHYTQPNIFEESYTTLTSSTGLRLNVMSACVDAGEFYVDSTITLENEFSCDINVVFAAYDQRNLDSGGLLWAIIDGSPESMPLELPDGYQWDVMGLYLLGPGPGAVLCLLKVLLSTFLFGNAFSFFYALAGSVLSYAVMLILKKHCSVVFVSLMGGMFHNLGQLLVAAVVLETVGLMAYLPVLLLCGLGAGCAVGVVGGILTKRIQGILKKV